MYEIVLNEHYYEIVLNEHSVTVAPTVKMAEKWLIKLAKTIQQKVIHEADYYPRRLWVSWKNDSTLAKSPNGEHEHTLLDFLLDPTLLTDTTVRLYLLSLFNTRRRFWDVDPEPAHSMSARKITSISACKPGSNSWEMCGLGFAFVRKALVGKALVVSLPSSSTWNCEEIDLPVKVTPPGVPTSETVQHASDPSHIP